MTTAELAACAWTSAWVAALLLAERRASQHGVWIAKPLASFGFLAAAWAAGALVTGEVDPELQLEIARRHIKVRRTE